MNKVLIGLTTYENLHLTKLALDSIWRNTPKLRTGEARLIVIDNNSKDDTVDYITRFSFVEKVIVSDRDCIAYQWNQFVDLLQKNEDFLIIPNDVVVGPNWLELLQEDTYKYDNTIVGSPYINCDLQYDKLINQQWAESYQDLYSQIKSCKTQEELEHWLRVLYYSYNFDDFCLDFQERNKNEPPIDSCVTHVMLFKNKLFKQHNFRFCEEYCPVYGSMEFDMICELNNLGYFRIASSRSYVHHWVSFSNQTSTNMTMNEKQKAIEKNNLHLLQKWEWVPDSTSFANIPSPSSIPSWRTPYHRFKLREKELSLEEAKSVPGTKYMSFQGLQPGHDYYSQVQPGSIVSLKINPRYSVKMTEEKQWYLMDDIKRGLLWNIDYYYRQEEENYHGIGHMDFLLER